MSAPLRLPPDIQPLLDAAIAAEKGATQGAWVVRSSGSDCFVERPRQAGEAYGVEIMGDDYAQRRGDAEFIVAAQRLILAMKAHAAPAAAPNPGA